MLRKPLKRAQLTCESRGYPITGIQLQKWAPVIKKPRDRVTITSQKGAWRTNHDQDHDLPREKKIAERMID